MQINRELFLRNRLHNGKNMPPDGLKPIEIGQSGQIKEWYDETTLGHNAKGNIPQYQKAISSYVSFIRGISRRFSDS